MSLYALAALLENTTPDYLFETTSKRKAIFYFELSAHAQIYAKEGCTFRPLTDVERAVYKDRRELPASEILSGAEKEALKQWRLRRCEELPLDRREALRTKAREMYADGSDNDIEIDDDAGFSESDHGTWVQAWVHVRHEELEEQQIA